MPRAVMPSMPSVVSEQFFVAAKVLNHLQLSLTIARIYLLGSPVSTMKAAR